MNKVYIIVYVPLIGEKYEVMIPASKKISSITTLLTKAVNELSGGNYSTTNAILYQKQNGKPYDLNITLKESDIRNGSEVILV